MFRDLLPAICGDGLAAGAGRSLENRIFTHSVEDERKKGLLIITSHWNWERFARERVWALKGGVAISRAIPGREAVVYLTRDGGKSGIGGLVELGDVTDGIELGGPYALFGHHVRLPRVVELRNPISITPLLERLEIFRGRSNYGGVLQGQALKEIPWTDFELLRGEVMSRQKKD